MKSLLLALLYRLVRTSDYSPGAYFHSKTIIIPHDSKIHRGGEDAAAADEHLMVVCDGVGGWGLQGIDPGIFSKSLAKNVLSRNKQKPTQSVRALVHMAKEDAIKAGQGTSTIVVVRVLPDKVQTFNIGDSGYSIWRYDPPGQVPITPASHKERLKLFYQSAPGQKSFNFPDQIGTTGDSAMDTGEIKNHDFVDKDIYVMFSDGVSDNLYVDSPYFKSCINKYLDQDGIIVSLSAVADCIAIKSYFLGKDKTYLSPFSEGARQAGYPLNMGGKEDDITVTVGQLFIDRPGEERRTLKDKFREEAQFVYTGPVRKALPAYKQDWIQEATDIPVDL